MESLVTKANVTVRPATLADIPFMDALQKAHSKQVGWMPTKQFEGKIAAGNVLIAEEKFGVGSLAFGVEAASPQFGVGRLAFEVEAGESALQTPNTKLQTTQPLGYCIGVDRYFKRDDVGIIYQMNVVPCRQRGFVGATLLKAQFERSAYGTRLYCCWCAQDIEANKFWEAMGFVPLAFRAGGLKRGRRNAKCGTGPGDGSAASHSAFRDPHSSARVHIFWQKRIRQDDQTTPYWFPSQTTGGAIGAGRIVLPIPPGTHWSDAKPIILPGADEDAGTKRLPGPRTKPEAKPTVAQKRPVVLTGGMRFGLPKPAEAPPVPLEAKANAPEPKTARKKDPRPKNDPKLIAAARELRDRWLEQVNSGEPAGLIPQITAKYDVRRMTTSTPTAKAIDGPRTLVAPIPLLEAA